MKISRQVSMCGETSLKQSENVHLGLSCSGGQPGSVIWDLKGHGSEGNSWSHQEMMRNTAKFHLGAKTIRPAGVPGLMLLFESCVDLA